MMGVGEGGGGGREEGGREGGRPNHIYTSILADTQLNGLTSLKVITVRLHSQSRYANWKPVTSEEMEGFYAVIINMGVIQLPEIELYWSSKWVGEIPFFG